MSIKRGVSLYSLQDTYYNRNIDLEGMVKFVSEELGATGIELLAEQSPVGSYPNPSDKDVDWWKDLMAKYGTEPVCMDSFIDWMLYKGRILTLKEQVQQMEQDLRLASRLGFKCIRVLCPVRAEVVEASASIAEYYNVKMGVEIHAPMSFDAPWMQRYFEMAERVGSPYIGVIPDFGIFQYQPNAIHKKQALAAGCRPEVVEGISEKYKEGFAVMAAYRAELEKKVGGFTPAEMGFAMSCARSAYSDPAVLKEYKKYIMHFHGKFYEIDPETLTETGINYEEPLQVMKDMGYDGYICSEFEGQRFYQTDNYDDSSYEKEELKLHHKMLKKMLGE